MPSKRYWFMHCVLIMHVPVHSAACFRTRAYVMEAILNQHRMGQETAQILKYVNIPCPVIVKEYNEHMGVVDLFDILILRTSLHKVDHKNPKWYRHTFLWSMVGCYINIRSVLNPLSMSALSTI